MANTTNQSRLFSVDFIDSNPATDAFQKAQKNAAAVDYTDANTEGQKLTNDFARASNPTRLRNMQATTHKNEVDASHAEEDAQDARSDRRSVRAERDARAQITFSKAINDALDSGDNDGADRIAKSAGIQIPDAWRQSVDMRRTMRRLTETAESQYDSAADQRTFIQKGLGNIAAKRQAGAQIGEEDYFNVPDAPAPTRQKNNKGFDIYQQPTLDAEGKPTLQTKRFDKGTGEASDVPGATGGPLMRPGTAQPGVQRAPNPDADATRRERLALDAARSDREYGRNPEATLQKYRTQYGLGATTQPVIGKPQERVPQGPQGRQSLSPAAPQNDRPEIAQARTLIGKGAPRAEIEKRLRANNIPFTPADLDLN